MEKKEEKYVLGGARAKTRLGRGNLT